ncbi:MAG: hypothetical protein ACLQRM_11775 [Acidimicrobiales bacterium]
MRRYAKLRGLVGLLLLTALLMAWDGNAKAVINKLSRAFEGGPRTIYVLPRGISRNLASGEVNLLSDPGFEEANVKICTFECNAASGWSLEHFSTGAPTIYRTRHGVVTGSYAEALSYRGEKGDNGVHKDVELYHGAVGPDTRPGHELTFTLWVSGTCVRCTPFVGIEAFDLKNHYLGESDQFFSPPKRPKAVRVSYMLPVGTVVVAAYIQVPELYSFSRVHLIVDDAMLVASLKTYPAPKPTYK